MGDKKWKRLPETASDNLSDEDGSDSEDDADLKVKKVKEATPKGRAKTHPLLPQLPFFMVVVAPRKSGKTNMILDMLLDKNKLRHVFDVIIIWSKTYHHDGKWKNITLPAGSVYTVFDPEEADLILKKAEEVNKNTVVNALMIEDDMIADGIMSAHRMGFWESLAVRGRHANVSVIMITQQYMSLSPSVRNNATNSIFFRIRNGDELDKIASENRESLKHKEFLKVYNKATEDPYNFLHVNNQQANPGRRFWKNWSSLLPLPNTTEAE